MSGRRPLDSQGGPDFFDDPGSFDDPGFDEPDVDDPGEGTAAPSRSDRRLVVEADGGSRGNPGPAAYGALVDASPFAREGAYHGFTFRPATTAAERVHWVLRRSR